MKVGDIWVHSTVPWIMADRGEHLVCDGRLISRKEYPELYARIGHSYSDEDARCCTSELFNLPDLREWDHADKVRDRHP